MTSTAEALSGAKRLLWRAGIDVRRSPRGQDPRWPQDLEPDVQGVIRSVLPFTMTSPERLYGSYQAAAYVVANKIPGSLVECGVWRGGSSMCMAKALLRGDGATRDLYLFDTFAGMTEPGVHDVDLRGGDALPRWRTRHRGTHNEWDFAPLEDVRTNMIATGYPADRVRYVVGDVLETVPREAPDTIALLRLDTDWYESTRHLLENLYPRLTVGGVLIIDDYGHWAGARKAVDEYFAGQSRRPLLQRIDYTGRLAIKVA